jgi:hypothetical protein
MDPECILQFKSCVIVSVQETDSMSDVNLVASEILEPIKGKLKHPPPPFFKDRMTVHRNRFLVNKTKRRTDFQFYWYYYFTCFGHPFCPPSGGLSRCTAKNS